MSQGCDASILIDSNSTHQAEKSAGANLGVREFGLIDQIKAKLEIACPQTVSCADIIALASRDAVALAGGPEYNIPTGRRDGLISQASEVTYLAQGCPSHRPNRPLRQKACP